MAPQTSRPQAPALRHRIMAGFIGNVVEWYDFTPDRSRSPLR